MPRINNLSLVFLTWSTSWKRLEKSTMLKRRPMKDGTGLFGAVLPRVLGSFSEINNNLINI